MGFDPKVPFEPSKAQLLDTHILPDINNTYITLQTNNTFLVKCKDDLTLLIFSTTFCTISNVKSSLHSLDSSHLTV